jgi:predicted ArsR family transcriptional regulator
MSTITETSDAAILDLLRRHGATGVSELAEQTGVTSTAVRQRLNRLMGQGLVERKVERAGRGRPSHKYSLTDKGRRSAGNNYADLAVTLWREVRAVKDPEVRRGLLRRIAESLAVQYAHEIRGKTLAEKMQALSELLNDREVPFRVEQQNELPVLTALACPYPDLAEEDHSICAMERMLFSEVLGAGVKLSECRVDGGSCCTFEAS